MPGYRGDLNRRLRHHRRGAEAGGLPDLHVGQVARHAVQRARSTTGRCSAASTGSTGSSRRRQLLRPEQRWTRDNDADRSADGRRTTTSPTRSRTTRSRYIDERASRQPFFLYVAFTSPHWPLHALAPDIARYKGRYKDGWDACGGAARADGQDGDHRQAVAADAARRRRAGVEGRARQGVAAAAHGGVCGADRPHGPGDWPHSRRAAEEGQLDNTLVLFLADNGGCAEEHARARSRRTSRVR